MSSRQISFLVLVPPSHPRKVMKCMHIYKKHILPFESTLLLLLPFTFLITLHTTPSLNQKYHRVRHYEVMISWFSLTICNYYLLIISENYKFVCNILIFLLSRGVHRKCTEEGDLVLPGGSRTCFEKKSCFYVFCSRCVWLFLDKSGTPEKKWKNTREKAKPIPRWRITFLWICVFVNHHG